MRKRRKAIIISKEPDFFDRVEKVLTRGKYDVQYLSSFSNLRDHQGCTIFDLALVDDRAKTFPWSKLFAYIDQNCPNAVCIEWSAHAAVRKTANRLHFQAGSEGVDLDSLLHNLSKYRRFAEARGELAGLLIHDARAPLSSMLGYLELLLNETFGSLNEGQQNLLEKTMILGDQALDMLEEINEVYRREQNIFSLEKQVFPLSQLIDEVLLIIWVKADRKDLKIKRQLGWGSLKIKGDFFQLKRVLVNLLENAVKYNPPGTTVIIRAERTNKTKTRISIIDNGGQIPAEELNRLFRKSYRAVSSEEQSPGTGMGLYISRLIVRAHGGELKAEQNELGGLSFVMTLPAGA